MPLFSIVTVCENEKQQTFILSGTHRVKDVPGGWYVKDFVLEYAKTNNINTDIGSGKIKKDDFVIYYDRIGEPSLTFFAFTNKNYSQSTAQQCIANYKKMAMVEFHNLNVETITKDMNKSISGVSVLLDTYYDGISYMKSDKLKTTIADATSKMNKINEKTEKLYNSSTDVKLMASQLSDDAEKFSTNIKKKDDKCIIF